MWQLLIGWLGAKRTGNIKLDIVSVGWMLLAVKFIGANVGQSARASLGHREVHVRRLGETIVGVGQEDRGNTRELFG